VTILGAADPLGVKESFDSEGHITYTSRYRVRSNDPMENPILVRNASGIPGYGSGFNWNGVTNQNATCQTCETDREFQDDSTRLHWIVTTTHSTKPNARQQTAGGGGGGGLQTTPVADRWRASGSFSQGTRITSLDRFGLPIMTTAKETKRFETLDFHDTLTLDGASLTMSLPIRAQAVGHCNSETIWGLTERKVLLGQWQWQLVWQGNVSYFTHRLEFLIKYDKWNEFWVNEGKYSLEFTPTGQREKRLIPSPNDLGTMTRLLDNSGQVISETALLNPSVPPIKINENEIIDEFDFTTLSGLIGMPNPLPGNFV